MTSELANGRSQFMATTVPGFPSVMTVCAW